MAERLKVIAPITPYIAVTLGLYVLRSAWAAILLFHIGMIIVMPLAKRWQLGEQLRTRRAFLVLVVVAVTSALGGLFIFWLWPTIKLGQLLLGAELANLGLSQTPWLLFIFYYFTVNPFLEEMFWRGYLGHKTKALAWTDVWYAGYHLLVLVHFVQLPWIIVSFVILVGASWVWRQLAREFNGLTIPIVSHAAADASIIGAVFFLA